MPDQIDTHYRADSLIHLRNVLTPTFKRPDGYEDADLLGPELEGGEFDNAQPPQRPEIQPVDAIAAVLVMRAIDQHPEIREIKETRGCAVVVEVPGPEWVDPIAEAFRAMVLQTEDIPMDGDAVDERRRFKSRTRDPELAWCEFRRTGQSRMESKDHGNATVANYLSRGLTVLGFSPSPDKYLPADLVRAADLRIVISELDAWAIELVAGVLTGELPSVPVTAELASAVSLSDIALARRPDQTPEDFIERLGHFASSKTKIDPGITLADLHGMDEAVKWGNALARDLTDYAKGTLRWSAVDRGALLYGPPGTGKTTFAKALSATCGVPLITGSLSEWQAAKDGHLGDLLKAMRAAFEKARKSAPCIMFIDEIDGFGDRRTFRSRYSDYSIQVVNAMLEELDGVGGREGVVVVGATNNPNRLDPALVRSGRLDRSILIPLPNESALALILRHHLGQDLAGADLTEAASLGLGYTGADCERFVRGARRRARHADREMVIDDLLAEIRGSEDRPSDANLRLAAVHEAGHALVRHLEAPGSVLRVTVRSNGAVGGMTVSRGRAVGFLTRESVHANLRSQLAGRAAEEVLLGMPSSGSGGEADSDLAQATTLATAAFVAYGLGGSENGLLWQAMPEPQDLGAMLAARPHLAAQVEAMLAEAYASCIATLTSHLPALRDIVATLLEKETIEGDEVARIVDRRMVAEVDAA